MALTSHPDDSQLVEIPECWRLEAAPEMKRGGLSIWDSYWEELSEDRGLFREQSDEYVRNLASNIVLDQRARVLDFGCGFGFVAAMLSPRVGQIFLWDASPNMRRRARMNLAGYTNVRFLDLSNSSTLVLHFDLILVNSVIQYMSHDDFASWLLRWRDLLGTRGRIIISDIIPPYYRASWDVMDLLRLSIQRRFLTHAIWQAFKELWRYWGVRRVRPLTRIGPEYLRQRATNAGMTVHYLPRNLTHFEKRLSAVFTPEGAK